MPSERAYCNILELYDALGEPGARSEAAVMRYIRAASDEVERALGGAFVPITEVRTYDGNGKPDLQIDPCLAVTAVTDDGDSVTSTQYDLYPLTRHWENGPYTRLSVDPDATELGVWTGEREAVAITGRWGNYEESEATGATTTQADGTTGSIVLSSAAVVAPGDVLLVESEQEFVVSTGAATDSTTNTNEALDNSEEEVDVVDGTQIFAGEIIRVEYEQMKVLDVRGNILVVSRGWNGTAKAAHLTAQDVYVYRTFNVVRGANGTTGAAHSAKAVSRYVIPYQVKYLTMQIASLMWRKAAGGFSGRVGNAELGEAFYLNEYPAEALREAQRRWKVKRL